MGSNEADVEKYQMWLSSLETGGVVEALTDILTLMYAKCDRPADAKAFIHKYFLEMFGFRCNQRLEQQRDEIAKLKEEAQKIKAAIARALQVKEAPSIKSPKEPSNPSKPKPAAPEAEGDDENWFQGEKQ